MSFRFVPSEEKVPVTKADHEVMILETNWQPCVLDKLAIQCLRQTGNLAS